MLLLLLLIGGGSYAWGETKTITLDKIGAGVDGTLNSSVKKTSISLNNGSDKFVLNYLQGKKQGDAIFLAKSTGAFISNNTPVPGTIKSVEVYINAGASDKTTYHCAFSTLECTEAYTIGSTAVNIKKGKSNVFSCGVKNANYFCVSLGNVSNGQVLKLVITYEDSSTPQPDEVAVPTLSLAEGTYWGKQTLIIGVPEGATGVQYTLDGTDPKESKTVELITEAANLELSATTTVRAIAVDNNNNYSKEVSRTYTFAPSIANTKETAYTTAQAIEIINKTSEAQLKDEVVYVKGIVSKIVTPFDSEYGNVSFDVSVDGSTEGEQFRFYRTQKDAENKFTEDPNIEVGATVIGCGTILLYKDKKTQEEIYEFAAGNYLVDYKAPVEKVLKSIAISGEATKTTYTEGEAFDPTGLVVTATYEDESTEDVTGRVKWTFNPETLAVGTTSVDVTANYQNVESTSFKVDVAVTSFDAVDCEAVDFTEVFSHVTGKDNEEVKSYQGTSFSMEFAKPQSSRTPTKYYANGTAVRAYEGNTITITAVQDIKYVLINYVKSYEDNGVEIKGLGTKTVVVTTSKTSRFTSITVYYKGVDFRAKSGENYYATFSCDRDVEFLEAEVFTVNVENGTISLNEIASKQVPANTGVLLRSTKESDVFTYIESAPAIEGTNLLKPASEKMIDGFKFYKLAYDNYTEKTGLGFYWGAENGGIYTVKPGLAYLAVPEAQAANVKGFSFDGTQTGINGVEATTAKGAIYNLNGQRVEKAQRGIYIQNGKKFIVK